MSYNNMINYFRELANAGSGVDADGAYGAQCVDIPLQASLMYAGFPIWGNAIDLLNSASQAGFQVEYNEAGNLDSKPKAGAFFVMDTTYLYGHPYGHTGVVIEDSDGYTMQTIEQNVDGNADSLFVGGPARYLTRDFSGVLGWFYIPQAQDGQEPDLQPSNLPSAQGGLVDEVGRFTVRVNALNVRNEPSLDAEIVAIYTDGMDFIYDSYTDADGYIWLSYVSHSGLRRYVACGQSENGVRINSFGEFSEA